MGIARVRIVEQALLLAMVLGGAMVFQGVVRGENDGCRNHVCKMIYWYYSCGLGGGVALQEQDCQMCSQAVGRCDGGIGGTCNPGSKAQKSATANVTNLCDCALAGGDNVEASVILQTGLFVDINANARECGGS